MGAHLTSTGESPDLTNPDLTNPDLRSRCPALTEYAPFPMALLEGAAHIVRSANPAFCRMLHKEREKILGKAIGTLLPGAQECLEALDRVFLTGKPDQCVRLAGAENQPALGVCTLWPLIAGEHPVGVMLQISANVETRDQVLAMNEALMLGAVRQHEFIVATERLNEQLRAEVQVRKRAEEISAKLAAIVESSDDAILSRDLSNMILSWNGGAEKLFGYSAAEMIGQSGDRLVPADRRGEESMPLGRIVSGGSVEHFETIRRRKDGKLIPVSLTISPIVDSQGCIVGTSKIARDISERRMFEDSLRERAAELTQADRSKDEFLAMLAHELRNPLAPLRNASELILSPGASPAARAQAQGIFSRQIANMSRMIDDLLDVSRITEGKIEIRKHALELEPILRAAVNLARPGIETRGQTLTLTLPPEPIGLDGDATRLEQVFGNLLSNASK